MTSTFNAQVREGMDVFDADNEKVGTLAESAQGYLRVPSGFLGLGKEHYIPLSAVRDVRGEEIHLNIARDQLDELESDPGLMESDGGLEHTTTTASAAVEQPIREAPRTPVEDDERTLQLREEELTARKRSVQTGAVALGTEVVSEQRTVEVPVAREEVTIERHPVNRRASDRPIGDADQTISVPVREEQVVADKQTVVYEEVNVGKRAVQDTHRVTDTVRREEAVVNTEGDVEVEGGTARDV
jgi:uncharacterized protein (TIGR02271 family)